MYNDPDYNSFYCLMHLKQGMKKRKKENEDCSVYVILAEEAYLFNKHADERCLICHEKAEFYVGITTCIE